MAALIPWLEGYAIGIKEIDQQHKYLFDLVNDVLSCTSREKLQLALLHLYKYTREHFKAEEKLMKSVNYTKYEHHVKLHDDLIITLNNKSKDALDDPIKREVFETFLVQWLIEHIIKEDLAISHFIQKNDLSIQ